MKHINNLTKKVVGGVGLTSGFLGYINLSAIYSSSMNGIYKSLAEFSIAFGCLYGYDYLDRKENQRNDNVRE